MNYAVGLGFRVQGLGFREFTKDLASGLSFYVLA